MKHRILHIIPSLGQGGAERVLAGLLHSQRSSAEHHVLSLLGEEPFFDFQAASIEVLGLTRNSLHLQALGKFGQLRHHVNRMAPDLVHSWLYHGNIFSLGAAGLGIPILWSIHNTTLSASGSKWTTRAINAACARLSRHVPAGILYCSETARIVHERAGYDPRRGIVVYNGVDLDAFRFDAGLRAKVRAELKLSEGTFLVGAIGRFDAQKNHPLIARAFARLRDKIDARLLLAGAGCSPDSTELAALLDSTGIADSTLLLGARHDVGALLSAIDVLVIASSFGEALPVIAIEASAAGLPIVATEVGDVVRFALDPSDIVPVGDQAAMTEALLRVRARNPARQFVSEASRAREAMLERYSLGHMSDAYLEIYDQLTSPNAGIDRLRGN